MGLSPDRDRRTYADRRLGERRLRLMDVTPDRRSSDRRARVSRRETASGHIRNAMQVVQDLLVRGRLNDESSAGLATVLHRLRLAVGEADRLTATLARLGTQLRVKDLPDDGSEDVPAILS